MQMESASPTYVISIIISSYSSNKINGINQSTCIAPCMVQTTLKRSEMDHTAFNLQRTPCLPLPRKRSPAGATTECCGEHLIAAHYSFIDPDRMKGWVCLVGWPIADGLPTCGRPSATGRAQDGERTLARDWRSTAEPRGPTGLAESRSNDSLRPGWLKKWLADCLYTGISSGPKARWRVWKNFTYVCALNITVECHKITIARSQK